MSNVFDYDIDINGVQLTMFDNVNGLYAPSALYLPGVAKSQNWDKREMIAHLILKTGVHMKDVQFSS